MDEDGVTVDRKLGGDVGVPFNKGEKLFLLLFLNQMISDLKKN